MSFRPKKKSFTLHLKLPQRDDLDARIEEAGLETLEYNKNWGVYHLRLSKEDVATKKDVLRELMQLAYERRSTN